MIMADKIQYEKNLHTVLATHLMLAFIVFGAEIAVNAMLYMTRSQGYAPATLQTKLLRYLVLTSGINFLTFFLSWFISKRVKHKLQPYVLMFFMVLMCADVSYSHYQFSICFSMFVVPLLITLIYENRKLALFTFGISVPGIAIGVIARAMDPLYNADVIPEAIIAFVVLCGSFYYILLEIRVNNEKNKRLQQLTADHEQRKNMQALVGLITRAIDAKDNYTRGHSVRVAEYSKMIANRMGLDEDEQQKIYMEGLVHDVGKIRIPDYIINKPGKLTDEEYNIIKSHPEAGYNILKPLESMEYLAEGAREHHERYDGRGYPNGLKGTEISLHGRILAVADSYDAMASNRSYRRALPQEKIRDEIVKGKGTQFDPEIADVMLELIDEDKDYKMREPDDDIYNDI